MGLQLIFMFLKHTKKWIGLASRIFVGSVFLTFGTIGVLENFFGFSIMEYSKPEEGSMLAQYFTVLGGTYLLKTVKIAELIGGFFLLTGIALPLGATILAPIVINIFLFHFTIDKNELVFSSLLVLGELGVAGPIGPTLSLYLLFTKAFSLKSAGRNCQIVGKLPACL